MKTEIEYFLDLLDLIPKELKVRSMLRAPNQNNSQEYTKENCLKYNIPYLPNFIDIDTYITGNGLRIQGYLDISIDGFWKYTIEQYEYIIDMIKTKNIEWQDNNGTTMLCIWNA